MAEPFQLEPTRIQLVAVNGTSDLWVDLTRWMKSLGVLGCRGRVVLCEKGGNFRVRVGIQSYDTDLEAPNTAVNPTVSATGCTYITTVSKVFFDFDPSNASNGNIGTKDGFRLGLLYSSTDATVSRGDVIFEPGVRRG